MVDLISIDTAMERHLPALRENELRHNMLLGTLERLSPDQVTKQTVNRRTTYDIWDCGAPGACAVHLPNSNIVLGAVNRDQAAALARATTEQVYAGVTGPLETALWFGDAAVQLGLNFRPPLMLDLFALGGRVPNALASGTARPAGLHDIEHVADWAADFFAEAIPDQPPPPRQSIATGVLAGHYHYWSEGQEIAALGAMQRETTGVGVITLVYTPPAFRARGYGGAVVGAMANRALERGKSEICMYVDRGKMAPRICYEKVGFRPVEQSCLMTRCVTPPPGVSNGASGGISDGVNA